MQGFTFSVPGASGLDKRFRVFLEIRHCFTARALLVFQLTAGIGSVDSCFTCAALPDVVIGRKQRFLHLLRFRKISVFFILAQPTHRSLTLGAVPRVFTETIFEVS